MSDVKLFNGDCLKVMQDLIDDDIKVDLVALWEVEQLVSLAYKPIVTS